MVKYKAKNEIKKHLAVNGQAPAQPAQTQSKTAPATGKAKNPWEK